MNKVYYRHDSQKTAWLYADTDVDNKLERLLVIRREPINRHFE